MRPNAMPKSHTNDLREDFDHGKSPIRPGQSHPRVAVDGNVSEATIRRGNDLVTGYTTNVNRRDLTTEDRINQAKRVLALVGGKEPLLAGAGWSRLRSMGHRKCQQQCQDKIRFHENLRKSCASHECIAKMQADWRRDYQEEVDCTAGPRIRYDVHDIA
jgi:hypothetical protein